MRINGAQAQLGQKVREDGKDSIVVDGETLTIVGLFNQKDISIGDSRKSRLWLVHKLAGELVSNNDPLGRPTVM